MREIGRGIALILKLRIEVTALESRLNVSFEHFEYIVFRIKFHNEQVVCPAKMWDDVFTTAAVDYIDHNPSSATSNQSLGQLPSYYADVPLVVSSSTEAPVTPSTYLSREYRDKNIKPEYCKPKSVGQLPSYYADVPLIGSSSKRVPIPPSTVVS
ncbi:hypothetical protein LSH36_914g00022 [Paralvinella palmiformis]|uniref:Uncharacterized protein n=1 Tax=Paralvinella palmiformis TaxID=53620 RepID=A0AAD9IXI6_9ANNE|nr:hypothetical protein LSH36_914g00022 [Paralvinella palmiformis]